MNWNKTLTELKQIDLRLKEINRQMNYENKIFHLELKDRQKLNLTKEQEIEHFNEFMIKYNLKHLIIEL